MGDPSLEVEYDASVFETLVVSVEETAASAPCPAEIQRQKVVDVESPGFVEAVVDLEHLEHPGLPVGTGTYPVQVAIGRRKAAAAALSPIANPAWGLTQDGAGGEHPHLKQIEVGTGVGHLTVHCTHAGLECTTY